MNFSDYKTKITQLPLGKQLPNALYIHIDSIKNYADELLNLIDGIKQKINYDIKYNVIKLFKSEFKVPFLHYPNFFVQPHQELKYSVTLNIPIGKIHKYNYSKSINSPILHREETLLDPNHSMVKDLGRLRKLKKLMACTKKEKISDLKIIGNSCFMKKD